MANNLVEKTFSEEQETALRDHSRAILTLQGETEGIAASIAYHLHAIASNKLYEISVKEDGSKFKGIGDYAEYCFDISKGTCSDTVATFERFGDIENKCIQAKYKDYRFSNLMAIKKLSDVEIDAAGITPMDTKVSIKAKIKRLEDNKAKEAMLPDKRKEAKELWDKVLSDPVQWEAFVKELLERGLSKETEEGPSMPDIDLMTYDQLSVLRNILDRHSTSIDERTPADSIIESDHPVSAEEPEQKDNLPDEAQEIKDKIDAAKPGDEIHHTTKEEGTESLMIAINPQLYAKIIKLINKETGSMHNAVAVPPCNLFLVCK